MPALPCLIPPWPESPLLCPLCLEDPLGHHVTHLGTETPEKTAPPDLPSLSPPCPPLTADIYGTPDCARPGAIRCPERRAETRLATDPSRDPAVLPVPPQVQVAPGHKEPGALQPNPTEHPQGQRQPRGTQEAPQGSGRQQGDSAVSRALTPHSGPGTSNQAERLQERSSGWIEP